jgi:hypothetical protein
MCECPLSGEPQRAKISHSRPRFSTSETGYSYPRTCTHKSRMSDGCPMSALLPKADIGTQPCDVCFVPKADIKSLSALSPHALISISRLGAALRIQSSMTITSPSRKVLKGMSCSRRYATALPAASESG